MKTIAETYSEHYDGPFYSEIRDDSIGRSHIVGWITNDHYFIATSECPKFDPRDGSPLTYIGENKEIVEQDAQKQYDEYCFRWENNKREKTKFPQELSDLLDSATTSCKILPTFDKDKEGDLSISLCFNGISIILNDNGTWCYSKPINS